MNKYRVIKKFQKQDGSIIHIEEVIDSETLSNNSIPIFPAGCFGAVKEINVFKIDSDSIKSPKEYALTLSPYEISLMQTALLSYTREMRGQPNLITDCGPYPALENLLRKLGDLV